MLEHLEMRWSRFLSESDVSRVNAAAGRAVDVHPETIRLFEAADRGWQLTGGRFDPTVLPAVVGRGYRTGIDVDMPPVVEGPGIPARGLAGVRIDRARSRIRVEAGSGFDPGAIGKGLAADIVVEALLRGGAAGALVNVGGDLRVSGAAPSEPLWSISIEHPFDRGSTPVVLGVEDGGVATSTARHGRWMAAGNTVCHVIDPATGAATETDASAVTVVAGEAWAAEAVATAALVAGVEAGLQLIDDLGLDGLVFDHAGIPHGSMNVEVPV